MRRLRTDGDGVCDDPAYGLAAYGVFLLAQFQEQRAFPKLLRLLTLSRKDLDIVLDDILHSSGIGIACITVGAGSMVLTHLYYIRIERKRQQISFDPLRQKPGKAVRDILQKGKRLTMLYKLITIKFWWGKKDILAVFVLEIEKHK